MEKTFFKGIPTAVDVKRLEDAFGIPSEDALINYEVIEKALQLQRRIYRFNTVLWVWRNKLEREYNLVTIVVAGEGIKVATPDERVTLASKKLKQGRRAIVRGSSIAATTDVNRLSDGKARELRQFLVDVPLRLRLQESLSMK